MRKKISLIAVLKSGAKIKDSVVVNKKNMSAVCEAVDKIESLMGSVSKDQEADLDVGALTFGKSTIRWSQIAAITFKEKWTV